MKGNHLLVPHPIKVLDANVYPLKGTNGKATHLMTLSKGFREFIFFTLKDFSGIKFYLEEITGSGLSVVEDPDEWEELCNFARAHGAGVTKAG